MIYKCRMKYYDNRNRGNTLYIVLPLFLALYIGQSFYYLTPFFKKFIQVCEEKKYEHSSANPLRTGTERFYELL